MEADKIRKEKKKKEEEEKRIIEERALALIEQYANQMDKDLYEETKNVITKKETKTTSKKKEVTEEKEDSAPKRGRRKLNTNKIAK